MSRSVSPWQGHFRLQTFRLALEIWPVLLQLDAKDLGNESGMAWDLRATPALNCS